MFKSTQPALLIIDMQLAIGVYALQHPELGSQSQPDAENNAGKLLLCWRQNGWPVIHIRHSSRFNNSPYHASHKGYAFHPKVLPLRHETVITKHENCGFLHTNLEAYLQGNRITELIVAGVLINHSVDATIRVASGLGFDVTLVNDATTAFAMPDINLTAQQVHDVFASNLSGEYCQLSNTSELCYLATQVNTQETL